MYQLTVNNEWVFTQNEIMGCFLILEICYRKPIPVKIKRLKNM
jgi:hypothetical protein